MNRYIIIANIIFCVMLFLYMGEGYAEDSSSRRFYEVSISRTDSFPEIIGNESRKLAATGKNKGKIVEMTFIPKYFGLKGTPVSVLYDDMEKTLDEGAISSDEIWMHAEKGSEHYYRDHEIKRDSIEVKTLGKKKNKLSYFKFVAYEKLYYFSDYNTPLYRASLLADASIPIIWEQLGGFFGLRFNYISNLSAIDCYGYCVKSESRQDEARYSYVGLAPEKIYFSWITTLKTDLHAYIGAGYMDEMFAGVGGEVLYRPFGKRYAASLEVHEIYKRDVYSDLALGFTGTPETTAFINLWYDLPETALTFHTKFGRFVAGDEGIKVALQGRVDGMTMEAYAKVFNEHDTDVSGNDVNFLGGVKFYMPLDDRSILGIKMDHVVDISPFNRKYGQEIKPVVDLYEATENFSVKKISASWSDILYKEDGI